MTILGYEVSQQTLMVVGAVLAYWTYSKAGSVKALLSHVQSGLSGISSRAQGLLTPDADIADVMQCLQQLDAYADKNGLNWSTDLKRMLAEAGARAFDKEGPSEAA